MKLKDYWKEIKKEVNKKKWDCGRIVLLSYILRDMEEFGANCDRHKTINEGIKGQIELERWKWALIG